VLLLFAETERLPKIPNLSGSIDEIIFGGSDFSADTSVYVNFQLRSKYGLVIPYFNFLQKCPFEL
jgi:hypothetical protein